MEMVAGKISSSYLLSESFIGGGRFLECNQGVCGDDSDTLGATEGVPPSASALSVDILSEHYAYL